jgi:hypothetical protein
VLRVGFLASHGGSGMRAALDAIRAGAVRAQASVVISNNSSAPALSSARQVGLPCYHLSAATHPVPEDLDAAIRDTLHRHATDIVLLSGYMKPVGPLTLERFQSRILNTHPGLLPRFGGKCACQPRWGPPCPPRRGPGGLGVGFCGIPPRGWFLGPGSGVPAPGTWGGEIAGAASHLSRGRHRPYRAAGTRPMTHV